MNILPKSLTAEHLETIRALFMWLMQPCLCKLQLVQLRSAMLYFRDNFVHSMYDSQLYLVNDHAMNYMNALRKIIFRRGCLRCIFPRVCMDRESEAWPIRDLLCGLKSPVVLKQSGCSRADNITPSYKPQSKVLSIVSPRFYSYVKSVSMSSDVDALTDFLLH